MAASGSSSTSAFDLAANKPLALFLLAVVLEVAWVFILIRHPGSWPIAALEGSLFACCVLQYGSRVFFAKRAVERARKISSTRKKQIRAVAKIIFIVGFGSAFSAAILGLVFEQRHAMALQTVGGTLAYFIPNCLLDFIGESDKPLYPGSPPHSQIIFTGSKPLHSSQWTR